MIYPKFIKEGSTIGVPAPSAGATNKQKINKFNNAKNNLTSLGFKLKLSKNLYCCQRGRSASPIERANEINNMFSDKDIDLILCAAGGNFLIEILPYIDFNIIQNNLKYLAGFSDPTGLLYPITTKYDIATIYGKNFSPFGQEELNKSHLDFLNVVTGKQLSLKSYPLYEENSIEKVTGLENYNLTEKVIWKTLDNKNVNIKGRIIGGCLDIIKELSGTQYDGIKEFNKKYQKDGIIWYFDNCGLSMEEVILTMWHLHELEYFKYAKGIIFGRFGENITSYNYDIKSCLLDSVISKLNIPIIYDADISHKPECLTIINGSIANIKLNNGSCIISYELK